MKLFSRILWLFLIIGFTSSAWAENTVVLGENGQVKQEQSEDDSKKDSKDSKEKKKKAKKEGEEEPDCE